VGAYAIIGTGADKHIGFDDNFIAGFYEMRNPADKVKACPDRPVHLSVIIGIAGYQGYLGFLHHFLSRSFSNRSW
jgi:hypothetical protein